MENGIKKITDRTIKLICQEFNVNDTWLRTGEGDMFNTVSDNIFSEISAVYKMDVVDKHMISVYLKMDETKKQVFKDFIRDMYLINEETAAVRKAGKVVYMAEEAAEYNYKKSVRLLGKVAGGRPILAVENHGVYIETDINCDCALQLTGNSMEPEYNDGDILLVRRQAALENSEPGIIMIMDGADIAEATFKKFYQDGSSISLKPINPDYPVQTFRMVDVIIFGKVVGKVKI
ncbi:MAG: hypothetical protein FIA99_08915 [Ruminiclostridium sp.]|nr:hypothetical protein [Ruminiclostridium sp.]